MTVNVILEITNRVPRITRALLLYRIVQLLSFPFAVIYLIQRLLDGAYWSHLGERLGFLPQSFPRTKSGSIWLHAVSAGEVASAIPLIQSLRSAEPHIPIYLSTTTTAGRKAAERLASTFVEGIFYAPFDFVSFIRRTLHAIRPALVIVLETEIWPHFYYETKRTGAALVIANGRISDRTWPRYRKLKWFFGPILELADAVFPQSDLDRGRYAELGVPAARLQSAGNLKYDISLSPGASEIPAFNANPVWICASTAGPNERGSISRHSVDEDEIAIRAFRQLASEFPRLLLILAPRQPARFDVVARKLQNTALNFIRLSQFRLHGPFELKLPGVLLLDTIGDLASAYSLAHAAFVGGSIAPRGGHNILEPAASGVPIVVGPHMENFEAIARDFLAAEALVQIQSEEDLLPRIRHLLTDSAHANQLGRNARDLFEIRRGASQRIAASVWPLYYAVSLRARHNLLAHAFLGALALLWRRGGALKRLRYERYAASMSKLPVPVVSIGAITAGGSGKTPFTTYLATRLRSLGRSPAILTRGYRRRSPARNLIFPPGARAPAAFTGDEAQIFLRHAAGPIGIGTNRYETAQFLLFQYPETDIIFLDDGFQHARLQRDFDVVLIDGLDPFGGEDVIPLGRLREPLAALSRADAFVVTRALNNRRYEYISARLREYNPGAPIFRTRLVARTWHDYHTGAAMSRPPARRVAGFCGLGNPENFWGTLESLGLEVVFRWEFDDHHSYKRYELQRIAHQARAHGAEILVTTEKDRINCPSHFETAIAPLDLAWLEIEIELEDEARFLALIEQRLGKPFTRVPAQSA